MSSRPKRGSSAKSNRSGTTAPRAPAKSAVKRLVATATAALAAPATPSNVKPLAASFRIDLPPCPTFPIVPLGASPKVVAKDHLRAVLFGEPVPQRALRQLFELDPDSSALMRPRFRLAAGAGGLIGPQSVTALGAIADFGLEWANGVERGGRNERFACDLGQGADATRPVIVAEGDSWFCYPLLLDDVLDQLNAHYMVWDGAAAGDTLLNMAFGPQDVGGQEYLALLETYGVAKRARAFLFSGAGNDVIGSHPDGRPMLADHLLPFAAGKPADRQINHKALDRTLAGLRDGYLRVIRSLRASGRDMPILVHGYDYVLPYPVGPEDPRDPVFGKGPRWLGRAFDGRGFPAADQPLRQEVCRVLIDALYDLLHAVAAEDPARNTHVVDCRETVGDVTHWNDEIHPTNAGFKRVAAKFRTTLRKLDVR